MAAADAARGCKIVSCCARLADDAKRVASKLSLSAVRSMGLTAAGGAERCRSRSMVTGGVRGSDGRAAGCLWW